MIISDINILNLSYTYLFTIYLFTISPIILLEASLLFSFSVYTCLKCVNIWGIFKWKGTKRGSNQTGWNLNMSLWINVERSEDPAPPKKFIAVPWAGKMMLTVFLDVRYSSNSSITEKPLTVTYNVRHFVAYASPSSILVRVKWEQLRHPPYSLDMLPSLSQKKALHLGQRTEGHSAGLDLVTATGFLGTGIPSARETVA